MLKKLTISLHDLYDHKYGHSLPIRDTLYHILNFFELKNELISNSLPLAGKISLSAMNKKISVKFFSDIYYI